MTDDDSTPRPLGAVWVRTAPVPDRTTYTLAIELTPDRAVPIPGERAAGAWSRAVLRAVAEAEYDAAVLRQVASLGLTAEHGIRIVQDLRARRTAVRWPARDAFRLDPGVSAFTGLPFLHVVIDGKPCGQWTTRAARAHALAVMEAAVVCELDSAYRQVLVTEVGAGDDLALRAVDGLGAFRTPEENN